MLILGGVFVFFKRFDYGLWFNLSVFVDSEGLPFVVFVLNHLLDAPLNGTMTIIYCVDILHRIYSLLGFG